MSVHSISREEAVVHRVGDDKDAEEPVAEAHRDGDHRADDQVRVVVPDDPRVPGGVRDQLAAPGLGDPPRDPLADRELLATGAPAL